MGTIAWHCLGQSQFFADVVHVDSKALVGFGQVRDGSAGVQHGGVVLVPNLQSNLR